MVVADRLADAPGAAVQHEPETARLVGLQLHEVIPAAQRPELPGGLPVLQRLQAWSAQRARRQRAGKSGPVLVAVACERDCAIEPVEHPGGRPRVRQHGRISLEGQGCHAAPDVASHRVWVERVARADDCPDAHVRRQMSVGHDGDPPHVVASGQAVEGGGHVSWRRSGEPAANDRALVLTQKASPAPAARQTRSPAPACGRCFAPPPGGTTPSISRAPRAHRAAGPPIAQMRSPPSP